MFDRSVGNPRGYRHVQRYTCMDSETHKKFYQFSVTTQVSHTFKTIIARGLYRKDLTVLAVRYHCGETSMWARLHNQCRHYKTFLGLCSTIIRLKTILIMYLMVRDYSELDVKIMFSSKLNYPIILLPL